jgi:DNA-binding PadR family transcriptional regulator
MSDEDKTLLEEGILAVFDDLRRESLDLHAFFELLSANATPDQAEVLSAIDRLVQRGWLEERGNDFYARTDAGRAGLWTGPRSA